MIVKKNIKFYKNLEYLKSAVILNILVFTLFLITGSLSAQMNTMQTFDKAMDLRYKKPDSSIILFQKSHESYLQNKDTINAVKSLMELSLVYANKAQYANSYNVLWNALLLTDNTNLITTKSVIYNRLGSIYNYFKREDKALEYLKKALEIHKSLVKENKIPASGLVPYYFSITTSFRELKKTELAQIYLDSSYLYFSKSKPAIAESFLEFETANILALQNENEKALKIFERIYPWFQENQPSYLVLFYKFWGDVYLNLMQLDKSETLYKKALKASEEYKSHIDFTPLIHEKLTELYIKQNDYVNAFKNLQIAKDLDAKFFDSRSPYNHFIMEIKDSYRLEKDRQEKLIQAQHLRQLEQEDKIKNLQRIILLVSVVFILIIGYFYIKNLRAKHKAEKQLIRRNKELEIKKAKELLELKNKELAASALQLIEKDEFMKNLKTKIREGEPTIKKSELNKILRSVSINNTSSWDEFKLRFIEVNKEFYDKIFEKYPKLSQGDQKICALIKLNMSSKEMSRLLGISVESVHTSRHRIRKKMNLSRDINLEDYINSL
ncbi:tetratricopeptide repeat protein [Algibacter amylolyticus]|uniref:Tetratricopeptide repeat protein n=1 Tax=Algibacter amylolyticus TaxID=1608400 RepID=A0A5M7B293_9FLAO|nr:tetratricopeptide repeat protein [Algibacter amylolyticus]KAA5823703.1 tetratricopeptide repeat protein [Algibacter amylolyticus]MBB5267872.1 tetratricopeptide (TPR) repeat protein [Algibacter amylolyticus]TSJ74191.1 tetratricopeptide repeat protein [Algibacter amylolyticus]